MVFREYVYSAEALWELSHRAENSDKRFELSEGMLIEMSPAGGKHGGIIFKLAGLIFNHVDAHDLGYGTGAETGYILFKDPNGKDTVRAPDIGFIAKARLPGGLPDGYIPLAPDLAIEVVSPNDDPDDVDWKVTQYLKYGVKQVWVLYPKSRRVKVHTPDAAYSLEGDDVLEGGDVLPGFSVKVSVIFS